MVQSAGCRGHQQDHADRRGDRRGYPVGRKADLDVGPAGTGHGAQRRVHQVKDIQVMAPGQHQPEGAQCGVKGPIVAVAPTPPLLPPGGFQLFAPARHEQVRGRGQKADHRNTGQQPVEGVVKRQREQVESGVAAEDGIGNSGGNPIEVLQHHIPVVHAPTRAEQNAGHLRPDARQRRLAGDGPGEQIHGQPAGQRTGPTRGRQGEDFRPKPAAVAQGGKPQQLSPEAQQRKEDHGGPQQNRTADGRPRPARTEAPGQPSQPDADHREHQEHIHGLGLLNRLCAWIIVSVLAFRCSATFSPGRLAVL